MNRTPILFFLLCLILFLQGCVSNVEVKNLSSSETSIFIIFNDDDMGELNIGNTKSIGVSIFGFTQHNLTVYALNDEGFKWWESGEIFSSFGSPTVKFEVLSKFDGPSLTKIQ